VSAAPLALSTLDVHTRRTWFCVVSAFHGSAESRLSAYGGGQASSPSHTSCTRGPRLARALPSKRRDIRCRHTASPSSPRSDAPTPAQSCERGVPGKVAMQQQGGNSLLASPGTLRVRHHRTRHAMAEQPGGGVASLPRYSKWSGRAHVDPVEWLGGADDMSAERRHSVGRHDRPARMDHRRRAE
jgi:hypothetical protein